MGIVAKFRDRCRASGGGKRKGATSRRGLAASPPPESQAVVGHGSDGVEPAATSPTPASPCSSDDPGGEGDKKRKNHPMGKSRGRASSSGLAASLLPEAQGAVPVVGFGASRVEPAALLASSSADPDGSVRLPPDMDGEMLQHLRTLGWKNPTTKAAFPQLDSSRDTLILCMKEPLLYLNEYLKLTTQALSDKVTPMDERAAFPQSDSSRDAFMLCVNETFLYLNENLKSTTQALSDKVTPMDVLDERVKKLDKLQKESDDEPSERTRQLEDVINTLQEKLIQVENDYQKKLETVSLANCDLKKLPKVQAIHGSRPSSPRYSHGLLHGSRQSSARYSHGLRAFKADFNDLSQQQRAQHIAITMLERTSRGEPALVNNDATFQVTRRFTPADATWS
ncbi:hypothetical protein ACQ4PT_038051 [Festuca glaucescens]